MFQKFSEYIDSKDKLQTKPIISIDADTGPEPKKGDKPAKSAKGGKGWKVEGAQVKDDEAKPYKGSGTDPGQPTYEKGLTYKGDEKLVYKPKVEDQKLKIPYGNKTENFINQTKELSSTQYAEFILSKKDGQATKKVLELAEVIGKNEELIETLVREIKRKGNFDKLMESILNQPETYTEFAISLASVDNSKNIARQLAKAINEITAPPEAEEDEEMPPKEKTRKAKKVKDTPVSDDNIMMSQGSGMIKPEHSLIEALASYKNIKSTMLKLIS